MRGGKFLAEESPTKLMEMHRLDTLEDVFLKLSRKQNLGLRRRSSILSSVTGVPPEDVSVTRKNLDACAVVRLAVIILSSFLKCARCLPTQTSYTSLLDSFEHCHYFLLLLLFGLQDVDDEMSGEFGDNVSISSRRRSVVIADDGNVMI